MGLQRFVRPTADGTTVTGTPFPVGTDAWDNLDDEFRSASNIVRGPGGGVETDPANDSTFIQQSPDDSGVPVRSAFDMGLIAGDDDIINLTFHIRARASVLGGNDTVRPFMFRASTNTDLSTAVAITGSFANYSFVVSSDPVTGAAWDVANLSNDITEFGVGSLGFFSVHEISRFYVEANFGVGATLGKWKRDSNWRYCDVCGTKTVYERLKRPTAPHPQAGLVVCPRCLDELDHETRMILSRQPMHERDDILY
jgi:hypothetical protein